MSQRESYATPRSQWDFTENWLLPGAVVPVDIPTTGALMREIKRLRALAAIDKHALSTRSESADIPVVPLVTATPAMPSASAPSTWREKLEEIASKLDSALGDSDLTHIEDDDELRRVAPAQWACSEINKLLQETPVSSSAAPDAMVVSQGMDHRAMIERITDCPVGTKLYKHSAPVSAIAAPKYLVRSGGECPQDWLCADIPEVQAAICEALYGRAEDADADEIGKYLAQVQKMTSQLDYDYEDGWLQILRLDSKGAGT